MDWKNDPALAEILKEFCDSFPARRQQIRVALDHWNTLEGAQAMRHLAHQLAGVAATYGFPKIGEISSQIDDALGPTLDRDRPHVTQKVFGEVRPMAEALLSELSKVQNNLT